MRFAQAVCTGGLHGWFARVVCTGGLHGWFSHVVHTGGLHGWLARGKKWIMGVFFDSVNLQCGANARPH